MLDSSLFLVIALILFSTKALSIFMGRLHLPQVVGALIAGLLLGPAALNIAGPSETLDLIAEFGVIFLLFSAGMETDFKEFRSTLKASSLISVLGIVAALGGGFAVAMLFGNGSFESFFIGVIIASMSTSITVEALQEMGKLKTKSSTAIMGASLLDDILVIMILAVTMGLHEGGISVASIAILLLRIAAFFAVATVSGYFVNKLFGFMAKKFGETRRLSIFAIAYCFIMAYLAEAFGLASITGAYIAGIAFCNTKCVHYLETKTHVLSYMLFTPVFMANIGIQTSFDGMTANTVLFTIALVAVAMISKFVGCGLGSKIAGYSNRESVQIGVGMIARGEVSFIIASKGIAAGFVSSLMFPSVVVVVVLTVFITPLLLKAAYAKDDSPEP